MLNEIEEAVGRRLSTANIAPIVWPNKASAPAKPYLAVQHVPTENENRSLNGTGGEVQRGYFIITVVAPSNTFATVANGKANDVKTRFPMGLALDAGTRKLRIWRPAQMLPGFADDADWRQPVRVDYMVTGK